MLDVLASAPVQLCLRQTNQLGVPVRSFTLPRRNVPQEARAIVTQVVQSIVSTRPKSTFVVSDVQSELKTRGASFSRKQVVKALEGLCGGDEAVIRKVGASCFASIASAAHHPDGSLASLIEAILTESDVPLVDSEIEQRVQDRSTRRFKSSSIYSTVRSLAVDKRSPVMRESKRVYWIKS